MVSKAIAELKSDDNIDRVTLWEMMSDLNNLLADNVIRLASLDETEDTELINLLRPTLEQAPLLSQQTMRDSTSSVLEQVENISFEKNERGCQCG